ncbi:hypothetical protein KAFR_0F02740 [Kazachstania africana CBS 2517]|uniref:GIT Spa2 homology (SHD) domain-containing protein n=1 Tax=Kazachstania africana (strain ATCC 22294 / BCRC 22015 / CBS 2517 / CECT 1963 / NBRC 1671 / NRRL Y-8276) TaxID=1071382 RepID=H2AWX1_KAZAF|nr:hypothetical protein KAFR_0F02740 [Kazachstania africana CBS 2517]CCF58871.1 hypothetical protein KAFR_0F02740 [Kazachstania africana CBS 2517]
MPPEFTDTHRTKIREYYFSLKTFADVTGINSTERQSTRSQKARSKLLKLSELQFFELTTDVSDELNRRINEDLNKPSHLLPKEIFHLKRNQARQKLANLSQIRFNDLIGDILYEISRRGYDNTPQEEIVEPAKETPGDQNATSLTIQTSQVVPQKASIDWSSEEEEENFKDNRPLQIESTQPIDEDSHEEPDLNVEPEEESHPVTDEIGPLSKQETFVHEYEPTPLFKEEQESMHETSQNDESSASPVPNQHSSIDTSDSQIDMYDNNKNESRNPPILDQDVLKKDLQSVIHYSSTPLKQNSSQKQAVDISPVDDIKLTSKSARYQNELISLNNQISDLSIENEHLKQKNYQLKLKLSTNELIFSDDLPNDIYADNDDFNSEFSALMKNVFNFIKVINIDVVESNEIGSTLFQFINNLIELINMKVNLNSSDLSNQVVLLKSTISQTITTIRYYSLYFRTMPKIVIISMINEIIFSVYNLQNIKKLVKKPTISIRNNDSVKPLKLTQKKNTLVEPVTKKTSTAIPKLIIPMTPIPDTKLRTKENPNIDELDNVNNGSAPLRFKKSDDNTVSPEHIKENNIYVKQEEVEDKHTNVDQSEPFENVEANYQSEPEKIEEKSAEPVQHYSESVKQEDNLKVNTIDDKIKHKSLNSKIDILLGRHYDEVNLPSIEESKKSSIATDIEETIKNSLIETKVPKAALNNTIGPENDIKTDKDVVTNMEIKSGLSSVYLKGGDFVDEKENSPVNHDETFKELKKLNKNPIRVNTFQGSSLRKINLAGSEEDIDTNVRGLGLTISDGTPVNFVPEGEIESSTDETENDDDMKQPAKPVIKPRSPLRAQSITQFPVNNLEKPVITITKDEDEIEITSEVEKGSKEIDTPLEQKEIYNENVSEPTTMMEANVKSPIQEEETKPPLEEEPPVVIKQEEEVEPLFTGNNKVHTVVEQEETKSLIRQEEEEEIKPLIKQEEEVESLIKEEEITLPPAKPAFEDNEEDMSYQFIPLEHDKESTSSKEGEEEETEEEEAEEEDGEEDDDEDDDEEEEDFDVDAFDIENPDNTLSELLLYLEHQTVQVISTIQSLLTSIKQPQSTKGNLRNKSNAINLVIRQMVDATSNSMNQSRNANLKEHGSWVVQSLKDCSRRIAILCQLNNEGVLVEENGDIDYADKNFKQRLAGIAFDVAKCTKELVKTVEEASLKEEIEFLNSRIH